jgi:hypothetical protein
VTEIDDLGRINLSHKQAMKELGREQKMPEGYEFRQPNHRNGPPRRSNDRSGHRHSRDNQ